MTYALRQRNRVFHLICWLQQSIFVKNPVSEHRCVHSAKETGFLSNLLATLNYCREKPGFRSPMCKLYLIVGFKN